MKRRTEEHRPGAVVLSGLDRADLTVHHEDGYGYGPFPTLDAALNWIDLQHSQRQVPRSCWHINGEDETGFYHDATSWFPGSAAEWRREFERETRQYREEYRAETQRLHGMEFGQTALDDWGF